MNLLNIKILKKSIRVTSIFVILFSAMLGVFSLLGGSTSFYWEALCVLNFLFFFIWYFFFLKEGKYLIDSPFFEGRVAEVEIFEKDIDVEQIFERLALKKIQIIDTCTILVEQMRRNLGTEFGGERLTFKTYIYLKRGEESTRIKIESKCNYFQEASCFYLNNYIVFKIMGDLDFLSFEVQENDSVNNVKNKSFKSFSVGLVLIITAFFLYDVYYLKVTDYVVYYMIAYNVVVAMYLFRKNVLKIK